MSTRRNEFLDHGFSDESDLESGYDSEAAELRKGGRAAAPERNAKRRKLSHSPSEDEQDSLLEPANTRIEKIHPAAEAQQDGPVEEVEEEAVDNNKMEDVTAQSLKSQPSNTDHVQKPVAKSKKKAKDKATTPGVIYLSSLPPYLKPAALRNLLIQRGFSPINRLFLTPASKAKSASKKNSRQMYTEGWVEFASKKTARRCAETLNAEVVGGKKGSFYHDDLWNMKYLKGMGWSELMAGIREERREEEGRRDEERRTIAKETKRFIEGVEEGRKVEGIKRKRAQKASENGANNGGGDDVKRTWRQFEVKGNSKGGTAVQRQNNISDDVREVLGKIF